MARLAVFNCKGGVGKTTTTLNLAAALHRGGEPPRLFDLDPQGHLTRILGRGPTQGSRSLFAFYQDSVPLQTLGLDWPGVGTLYPSHGLLMKVDSLFGKGPAILNKLRVGLDALDGHEAAQAQANGSSNAAATLIDCCPYVGVLSLNAVFGADAVLVPVSTDFLSLQAAQQIAHTLAALEPVLKRRMPRRYVLTRYDRRRRMSGEIFDQMRASFGDEVCATVIAENVALAESPALGRDVFSHAEASHGARDYARLFAELRGAGFL